MKTSALSDRFLKLMKPEDRARMGVMTGEEAMQAFQARSEKELQKQIADLLRLRGIAFHCARMDKKTSGSVGWPDFTMAVMGTPIAWEVKFDGGRLSSEQERTRDKMLSNGWQWRLITNLGAARAHLDSITLTYIA